LKVIDATIKDRLVAGIRVGNRHYRVLGGSNSLVREHGYYLCATCKGITAEVIRKKTGNIQYKHVVYGNKTRAISFTRWCRHISQVRWTTKLSCDVKLCEEFWSKKIIKIKQQFLNL